MDVRNVHHSVVEQEVWNLDWLEHHHVWDVHRSVDELRLGDHQKVYHCVDELQLWNNNCLLEHVLPYPFRSHETSGKGTAVQRIC